jgi:peptide/nickel transport system permease protein
LNIRILILFRISDFDIRISSRYSQFLAEDKLPKTNTKHTRRNTRRNRLVVGKAQTGSRKRRFVEFTRDWLKGAPVISLGIVAVLIFVAVFANVLPPHSPYYGSLADRLVPPVWTEGGSSAYLLGTDAQGRDILSRIILGARITLIVAFVAVVVAGLIGTVLGLISGYSGGIIDAVTMRTCDAMFSFPIILIALIFAVILGPSLPNLTFILVLAIWAPYARVVRGETLTWKERDFVAYARVAGTSPYKIIARHLLPNVLNSVLVMATFNAAFVIILEASLSFLGAGVPPPTPSWGSMTADGRQYVASAWWISLFPGAALVLVVLSLNLLGDWLRDRLDPKLRQL